MNLKNTPSLKREPTRPHWDRIEYTSHDGRTTRQRTLTNAVIALYGKLSMPQMAQPVERSDYVTEHRVRVLDLVAFRRDGSMVEKGTVSWVERS